MALPPPLLAAARHRAQAASLALIAGLASVAVTAEPVRFPGFRAWLPEQRGLGLSAESIVINDRLLDRVYMDELIQDRFKQDSEELRFEDADVQAADLDSRLRPTGIMGPEIAKACFARFEALREQRGIEADEVGRAMMEGRLNPHPNDLYWALRGSYDAQPGDALLYARQAIATKICRRAAEISGGLWGQLLNDGVLAADPPDRVLRLPDLRPDRLTQAHFDALIAEHILQHKYAHEVRLAVWSERYGDMRSCIGVRTVIDGKPAVFDAKLHKAWTNRFIPPFGNNVLAYFGPSGDLYWQENHQVDYAALRRKYLAGLQRQALASLKQ